MAVKYARVFGTPDGRVVLEDITRFLDAAACFDPSMGFYNGAALGYYREGIRELARQIRRMVKDGTR